MFPAFSTDNRLHTCLMDAPLSSKLPNRRSFTVKAANLAHIIGLKAGRMNRFAYNLVGVIHATFGDHIAGIFRHSSKPEMSGVNARRIITMWTIVQNVHAFWDNSKVKFPGNTVTNPTVKTRGLLSLALCGQGCLELKLLPLWVLHIRDISG